MMKKMCAVLSYRPRFEPWPWPLITPSFWEVTYALSLNFLLWEMGVSNV